MELPDEVTVIDVDDYIATCRPASLSEPSNPDVPLEEQPSTAGEKAELAVKRLPIRSLQLLIGASSLSLVPVLLPFGNPYDVDTPLGYLRNSAYFVWYCGTGWGSLWIVQLMWANALLGQCNGGRALVVAVLSKATAVPTLFAVVLFLAFYILLGGPFPLGTLILGAPCFAVAWGCLWRWELRPGRARSLAFPGENGGLGARVLALFAIFVLQLCCYGAATCLILRFPESEDVFSVVFRLGETLLERVDAEEFLKRGEAVDTPIRETEEAASADASAHLHREGAADAVQSELRAEQQCSCANGKNAEQPAQQDLQLQCPVPCSTTQRTAFALFGPLWFLALHVTYLNFLFPVLSSFGAVITGCAVKLGSTGYAVWCELRFSDLFRALAAAEAQCGTGYSSSAAVEALVRAEARALEKALFSRLLALTVDLLSPVLFGGLFVFNLYGWNHGMFYSSVDATQQQNVNAVFFALLANFVTAFVLLAVYACALLRWRAVAARAAARAAGAPAGAALSHRVLELVLSVVAERALLCFGCVRWASAEQLHLSVSTASLGGLLGRSSSSLQSGDPATPAASAEERRAAPPGGRTGGRAPPSFFLLFLMTQGAVTTIVGVCMVMKHDGMDLAGLMRWALDGEVFPYPLQPLWTARG